MRQPSCRFLFAAPTALLLRFFWSAAAQLPLFFVSPRRQRLLCPLSSVLCPPHPPIGVSASPTQIANIHPIAPPSPRSTLTSALLDSDNHGVESFTLAFTPPGPCSVVTSISSPFLLCNAVTIYTTAQILTRRSGQRSLCPFQHLSIASFATAEVGCVAQNPEETGPRVPGLRDF